jgi:hypothetical protein
VSIDSAIISCWFECPRGHSFAEEGGSEILLRRDAGEGGLVAAGVLFPEREVVDVSFLIAAERGGLDAVRVMGMPLGIDELVISRPCGAGFGFEEGRENEDAAVALAEVAEDGLGIGGEQQVG